MPVNNVEHRARPRSKPTSRAASPTRKIRVSSTPVRHLFEFTPQCKASPSSSPRRLETRDVAHPSKENDTPPARRAASRRSQQPQPTCLVATNQSRISIHIDTKGTPVRGSKAAFCHAPRSARKDLLAPEEVEFEEEMPDYSHLGPDQILPMTGRCTLTPSPMRPLEPPPVEESTDDEPALMHVSSFKAKECEVIFNKGGISIQCSGISLPRCSSNLSGRSLRKAGASSVPQSPTSVSSDRDCPICLDRPSFPVQGRCRHPACFACLALWMTRKQECPACCQPMLCSDVRTLTGDRIDLQGVVEANAPSPPKLPGFNLAPDGRGGDAPGGHPDEAFFRRDGLVTANGRHVAPLSSSGNQNRFVRVPSQSRSRSVGFVESLSDQFEPSSSQQAARARERSTSCSFPTEQNRAACPPPPKLALPEPQPIAISLDRARGCYTPNPPAPPSQPGATPPPPAPSVLSPKRLAVPLPLAPNSRSRSANLFAGFESQQYTPRLPPAVSPTGAGSRSPSGARSPAAMSPPMSPTRTPPSMSPPISRSPSSSNITGLLSPPRAGAPSPRTTSPRPTAGVRSPASGPIFNYTGPRAYSPVPVAKHAQHLALAQRRSHSPPPPGLQLPPKSESISTLNTQRSSVSGSEGGTIAFSDSPGLTDDSSSSCRSYMTSGRPQFPAHSTPPPPQQLPPSAISPPVSKPPSPHRRSSYTPNPVLAASPTHPIPVPQ
eukprot:EG_transcript_4817